MKFKKNILSNVVLHILSIGIGFLTSVLIARGLGPSNQGQFSFYVLIFNLIVSYGDFGIISSTSYYMKKTKYKEEDVINNNISLLIVLCLLYFAVIVIFKDSIFYDNTLWFLIIWSVYYITSFISTCLMEVYTANENVYIFNRYLILIHFIKALFICPLYFTGNVTIISVSIVYAVLEIIKLVLMKRGLKVKYKFSINMKMFKEELKYGIPLYLAALFIYLNYRVDQVMVKYYINNSALGIYALSVTLAELAKMVPDSVVSAFTGKLYNCKEEEKKRIVTLTIKMSFYMTVLISIIGLFCRPLVPILYGQEYNEAGLSMIILLCGIPFLTVGKVSSVYFYTNGKTRIHMLISFVVLILNIALNFVLIPQYGIYGAAFTSSVSYFLYAILYLIALSIVRIPVKEIILIDKSDFKLLKKIINEFNNKLHRKCRKKINDNGRNMIFYIPNKLDITAKSGSSLRPFKMLEAFKENGYNVDCVMGCSIDRKKAIKKIKNNIKNGKKYDFIYSESSTMPTLLTDKNHLPLHPFMDFNFFKYCKKHDIRMSLFYRDIHWKFDLYKKNGWLKSKIAIFFYKYDLNKYDKLLDYMYIPSEKFREYLPKSSKYDIRVLYPGCSVSNKKKKNRNDDKKLHVFYVGGISKDIYDFEKLIKIVNSMDNIELTLCCRENEWNKSPYRSIDMKNVHVIHEMAGGLQKYYDKADVCSLLFEKTPYMSMAMPIKLFEYIGNRLPMIATDGTQAAEFIRKYNIGYTINYDEREINELLKKLVNNKKMLINKVKNIETIINDNTWKSRAKEVIKDMVN